MSTNLIVQERIQGIFPASVQPTVMGTEVIPSFEEGRRGFLEESLFFFTENIYTEGFDFCRKRQSSSEKIRVSLYNLNLTSELTYEELFANFPKDKLPVLTQGQIDFCIGHYFEKYFPDKEHFQEGLNFLFSEQDSEGERQLIVACAYWHFFGLQLRFCKMSEKIYPHEGYRECLVIPT